MKVLASLVVVIAALLLLAGTAEARTMTRTVKGYKVPNQTPQNAASPHDGLLRTISEKTNEDYNRVLLLWWAFLDRGMTTAQLDQLAADPDSCISNECANMSAVVIMMVAQQVEISVANSVARTGLPDKLGQGIEDETATVVTATSGGPAPAVYRDGEDMSPRPQPGGSGVGVSSVSGPAAAGAAGAVAPPAVVAQSDRTAELMVQIGLGLLTATVTLAAVWLQHTLSHRATAVALAAGAPAPTGKSRAATARRSRGAPGTK